MAGASSPTVRRRELGAVLRSLRIDAGLTVDQVAEQLLCSPSKISRLETGQRGASARDIRDLCDLYQVLDPERRQYMATLAREGKDQAWWKEYDLPHSAYIGLEAAAIAIRDYHANVVPGLLQTAEYARAVSEVALPLIGSDQIDQHVEVRLARQEIIYRESPPQVEIVLDESALHRIVGTHEIMSAQLKRIVEMAQHPNITIQVVPYSAGALAAVNSNFTILGFSSDVVSDVVFVEGLVGDLYLEKPAHVKSYHDAFTLLQKKAAATDKTNDLITATLGDWRA